jgi:hypothetical protein
MKINLDIAKKNHIEGYVNITGEEVIKLGDIHNAECMEIQANDTLDYIPYNHHKEVILLWLSKLRKRGRIYIKFNNAREISRLFVNGEIDIKDFNQLVFAGKTSVQDLMEVKQIVESKTVVEEVSIIENSILIMARRP